MNKRLLLIALTTGLIVGSIIFYGDSLVESQTILNNYHILEQSSPNMDANPITLFDAWDAVQAYAQTWSEDASLIFLESSDIDDPNSKQAGQDGKRRTWYAAFTSSKLNKQLFLQLTDGVVTNSFEDGLHDTSIPTITEKPVMDSPEILEKVKTAQPDLDFGIDERKGYHFILQTGKDGTPTLNVAGAYQLSNVVKSPAIVIFDPDTGQVESQYYTFAPTGGVLYSIDSGQTWQASNLTNQMVTNVARDLNKLGVAYAVVAQPEMLLLYQTENGGREWIQRGKLPVEAGNWAYDLVIANFDNEDVILVSTISGVWLSTGGNDWKQLSTLPPNPTGLAILQENKTAKIFANVITGLGTGTLYSSTDLDIWITEAEGAFRLSESFDYRTVAATNEDETQAFLFGSGKNSALNVPLGTLRLAGDFGGDGPIILDGADNGQRFDGNKESDNYTWKGVLPSGLASLAASPNLSNKPIILAGGFRTGLYRSVDGGGSWENVLENPSLLVTGSNELHTVLFLSEESVITVNGGTFSWESF